MADLHPYPGTPRWVKVSGIVFGGLVLLVAIMVITGVGGPHGPGRHTSPGDAGGQTQPSGAAKEPTPADGGFFGQTPPKGGH